MKKKDRVFQGAASALLLFLGVLCYNHFNVREYSEVFREAAAEPAPKVALTFDDGPDPVYTPKLLDGLKERKVHVTFFLIGKKLEGQEDLVRRIQQEGHLIGNHTYSHVDLSKLSESQAKEEIEKTSNSI